MTERTATIKVRIDDGIGNRLLELKQQRDALLSRSAINLRINADGLDQARQAAVRARAESAAAMKDLTALGGAITSQAVAPMAQYQAVLSSAIQASKILGAGGVAALKGVSGEFQRQRTLAQFWGTSGYMHQGIHSFRGSIQNFLATGGSRFTGWLTSVSAQLTQYRTALTASAAVMVGFAAAAGLSSKHAQNYIQATMGSRLMARKLSDRAGAEAWIQAAQSTDWSGGRESRMGVFQTVLSKNPYVGQKEAQKATENIEKFFFANQEMLRKKGYDSAEALASAISAPQLAGEDATKFEDIFGLGFAALTPRARLGRLSTEAAGINVEEAVAKRPDVVLADRLGKAAGAIGDSVLPVLNQVLGLFLDISNVIAKIPGLGPMLGWAAVIGGAAAAGLIFISMVGSLIPGLMTVIGVLKAAAAAQTLLNVAMLANPIGLAILAVAGLAAGLYVLEKKFGILTKAWNAFKGSGIGKAIAGADMKGVLRVAADVLGVASPGLKVLLMLFDFIRKIWINSGILNKLIAGGVAMWQKMVDFFGWLLSLINNMIQWIREGLGINKSEARSKMETAAQKAGVYWDQDGRSGPGWYKNSIRQDTGPTDPRFAELYKLKQAYDKTPGSFAEAIPGIANLTKAIEALTYVLEHPVQAGAAAAQGVGNVVTGTADLLTGKTVASSPQLTGSDGNTYAWDPKKKAWRLWTADPTGTSMLGGWFDDVDQGALPADIAAQTPQMAAGGQIRAAGSLIGHRGEEIAPASVVAGGRTVLEELTGLISGGRGGGQPIAISAPVSVHVEVGQVSSDLDIERLATRIGREAADKLMFGLRTGLDNTSLRAIAYMRG
ncbi:MAG: hypothetical protein A4E45_01765 [Methanosaeta sp. PtaB.Bin039]|nr:MAG: hypothetical protein A4E45_01765 [Methanosaeta sp. PtaB.Bin039]